MCTRWRHTLLPICGWGLLGLFGNTALAQGYGTPVPEIYTCIDANGNRHTSDRWIVACNDRAQTILNPSGTVKIRLPPRLTAEERLQQERQQAQALQSKTKSDEDRKRDRALLARYPTLASHQQDRAQTLARLADLRGSTTALLLSLKTSHAKLADEMAFFQKDPSKAPPKLRQQFDDMAQALVTQEHILADTDTELDRLNARFDDEQKRLAPLWRPDRPNTD